MACHLQGSNSSTGDALSALAAGTFLYVAAMEIIPKELSDDHSRGPVDRSQLYQRQIMRGIKLAMLACGFGAMSVLAIWA
jgi:zinc transporter 1/2/3